MSGLHDRPLCTIAIPVYHRMEKALAFAAVESAIAERRSDVEILVIDDHTTDGTWDHLTQVVKDPRARLLRNERNLGLFQNFNRCLDEARGRYVRVLCSDDLLEPRSLDEELAVMERHPEIALLSTRGLRVDLEGHLVGLQAAALPEGIYCGDRGIAAVLSTSARTGYNALNYPSGVLLRKAAADAAGRFRTDMRVLGDVEYFLRVLRRGALGVLHRVGCRITVHRDQVGSRFSLDPSVMQEQFRVLDEFEGALGSDRSTWQVRQATAGISALLAIRSVLAGNWNVAREHVQVARRNGIVAVEMTHAFMRLLAHRLRWKLRGPFAPNDIAPDRPLQADPTIRSER